MSLGGPVVFWVSTGSDGFPWLSSEFPWVFFVAPLWTTVACVSFLPFSLVWANVPSLARFFLIYTSSF